MIVDKTGNLNHFARLNNGKKMLNFDYQTRRQILHTSSQHMHLLRPLGKWSDGRRGGEEDGELTKNKPSQVFSMKTNTQIDMYTSKYKT